MRLQYALLLIGIVIIGVVALTVFDRSRFLQRRRSRAEEPVRQEPEVAVRGQLDIDPMPPQDDIPVLRPDAAMPVISAVDAADAHVRADLDDLEFTATVPLNLSLGLGDTAQPAGAGAGTQSMPDETIDFIVNLPGKRALGRDQVLAIFKQPEYHTDRPRFVYGLGQRTGLWSNLERDPERAEYTSLALALQLADSGGAVSETELHVFMQLALKMGDTFKRATKFTMTFEEAVQKAARLHEFVEKHDVLASLRILANHKSGFTGRAVDLAAARFGLQYGPHNIYHRKNDNLLGCRHLFSLANLFQPGDFPLDAMEQTTVGLTLFMNVSCAYQPTKVFDRMVETARGLCNVLDAHLEDQDGRQLTDQGLMIIRAQIEHIAAEMQKEGVVPGGPAAMRLFRD